MVMKIEGKMKMNYRHIIYAACFAAVFSCTQFEENAPQIEEVETVQMTFMATIGDDTDTKTTLDGTINDVSRKVLWLPEDDILIASSVVNDARFVNNQEEESATGFFEGGTAIAPVYYAAYPYSGSRYTSMMDQYDSLFVTIPKVQKYKKESFGQDAAPMVATAAYGEPLNFKNTYGLLALSLTGEECIQSITFSGKDANGDFAYVSGMFNVSLESMNKPTIKPVGSRTFPSYKSITLECDEPVQLNPTEGTQFYFVLPPATYHGFLLTITTADGRVMMKEATKPLTITRSNVQGTADLQYVETVSINLSAEGIANSYIVSESGLYSFQANVIGNGEGGIIKNAGFHTEDASISPVKAELVWSDNDALISKVSYDEAKGRIIFYASGEKGNAVVAAKDADNNIIWSWHIWATDKPEEQTYINSTGTYALLDRNLGATSAQQSVEAVGLLYQWGRKDPFCFDKYTTMGTFDNIEQSIADPLRYGTGDSWMVNHNSYLWSSDKTIYDPCPAGWKVAVPEVWNEVVIKQDRNDYPGGITISYNGSELEYWYQDTPQINIWGTKEGGESDDNTELWTARNRTTQYLYYGGFYTNGKSSSEGFPVRCMKDEANSSVFVQLNSVTNVTASSATASSKVVAYGYAEVTEAGFVVGNKSNITLETGTKFSAEATSGEISVEMTGLEELTKYYVRAFATYAGDTAYSEPVSFITPNTNGVVDLSVDETANSYIVLPTYCVYSFKAVKGNSNESVGEISSAEILWETYNTSETVIQNSVIASVGIDGENVKFTMPENARPGNALIAVKDASGTILWSWHIWVADFDPETTQQKYISGAIMMDRNLGAISANPVNDWRSIENYEMFGLYYQWGRKDPFPYLGYANPTNIIQIYEYGSQTVPIEDATHRPTDVFNGVNWSEGQELWRSSKTIYDPCPSGWRVPDTSIMDGWNTGSAEIHDGYKKINPPYSTPAAYYPIADRIGGFAMSCGFDNFFIWTTTHGYYLYSHSSDTQFTISNGMGNDTRMVVRCMKETTMNGDSNEGYTESDDYEW